MTDTEVEIVACLNDNYAYLVHDRTAGGTVLVDAPESGPILAALGRRGWSLDAVLITHHHGDHIDGLGGILARHKATVVGAAADAHRLPPLDRAVREGDVVAVGGLTAVVLETPGHTSGHVAYHLPAAGVAFTADTLFSLGCGRLFEGTAADMWMSLLRLRGLPAETKLYCGHEYTAANGRFALSVDPENAALLRRVAEVETLRAEGRPTLPTTVALERATNPFLRADEPALAAAVGLDGHPPVEVFAELRRRKDTFR